MQASPSQVAQMVIAVFGAKWQSWAMTYTKPTLVVAAALLLAACEAETPRPPAPDDTCFKLSEGLEEYCPASFCFDEKYELVETKTAQDQGFRCYDGPCKLPPPDLTGVEPNGEVHGQGYTYRSGQYEVVLGFDNTILLGYSLENFRKYLIGGGINVILPDGVMLTTNTNEAATTTEFVDYKDGLLHVRVDGIVTQNNAWVDTEPHVCWGGHSAMQELCLSEKCVFAAASTGANSGPVHLSADIRVPVEAVSP
mgnify:CR=1 FL=1